MRNNRNTLYNDQVSDVLNRSGKSYHASKALNWYEKESKTYPYVLLVEELVFVNHLKGCQCLPFEQQCKQISRQALKTKTIQMPSPSSWTRRTIHCQGDDCEWGRKRHKSCHDQDLKKLLVMFFHPFSVVLLVLELPSPVPFWLDFSPPPPEEQIQGHVRNKERHAKK